MIEFFHEFWAILGEMSPYLLFGFLIAGLLSVWIPKDIIERHLGGRGFLPTLKATVLGIPLPICSCGVIPVAAGLRRHGASKGATASFLISTPQTGVDSILVTLSLLGPLFAIYRPLAAFITGVAGGMIVDTVDKNGEKAAATLEKQAEPSKQEESSCQDSCCSSSPKVESRFVRVMKYAFVTLPADIGKSLLVGLLIAALITTLVEPGTLSSLSGIWAMLGMLVISIPLYVCATGSVPMAQAFIFAGLSPGAALVFLVAGPATNAAAITTIWKILGSRAAITYLSVVASGALLGGLALDGLFSVTGTPHACESIFMLPDSVNSISAIILLLILANAMWPRRRKKIDTPEENSMDESLKMNIKGMSCSHCEQAVYRLLSEQDGVTNATVDLASGTASITGHAFSKEKIYEEIAKLGYKASCFDDCTCC